MELDREGKGKGRMEVEGKEGKEGNGSLRRKGKIIREL